MLAMALDVLGIHSVAQWKNKEDEEVGVKVDGEWVGRGEGWKGGQSQAVKGSPIRMAVMTDASLKGVQHLHSLGHGIGCRWPQQPWCNGTMWISMSHQYTPIQPVKVDRKTGDCDANLHANAIAFKIPSLPF